MTDEEKKNFAEKNAHIPTDEILQDIVDTETEIKNLQDEKEVLNRNPFEHKTRIYFLVGNILRREKFVNQLKIILEYRNKNI